MESGNDPSASNGTFNSQCFCYARRAADYVTSIYLNNNKQEEEIGQSSINSHTNQITIQLNKSQTSGWKGNKRVIYNNLLGRSVNTIPGGSYSSCSVVVTALKPTVFSFAALNTFFTHTQACFPCFHVNILLSKVGKQCCVYPYNPLWLRSPL